MRKQVGRGMGFRVMGTYGSRSDRGDELFSLIDVNETCCWYGEVHGLSTTVSALEISP